MKHFICILFTVQYSMPTFRSNNLTIMSLVLATLNVKPLYVLTIGQLSANLLDCDQEAHILKFSVLCCAGFHSPQQTPDPNVSTRYANSNVFENMKHFICILFIVHYKRLTFRSDNLTIITLVSAALNVRPLYIPNNQLVAATFLSMPVK